MSASPRPAVTFADVEQAYLRIAPYVRHTPMVRSHLLDELAGCELWLKGEHLQKGGSFKLRGALNKILLNREQAVKYGVVAYSSGNHAQGVALAAAIVGAKATIVMPADAPQSKLAATRGYGATVVTYDRQRESREAIARALVEQSGALLVPPFDDLAIIAGQGSVGLEIAADCANADIVLAQVGGGGLLSGTSLAVGKLMPDATIIGVEPTAANDAQQSFQAGRVVSIAPPKTIADGLATPSIAANTLAIFLEEVDDIVTVSEEEIRQAQLLVMSRTKQVVEPSGVVAVAAVLAKKIDCAGKRVVAVLSGGNVDLVL